MEGLLRIEVVSKRGQILFQRDVTEEAFMEIYLASALLVGKSIPTESDTFGRDHEGIFNGLRRFRHKILHRQSDRWMRDWTPYAHGGIQFRYSVEREKITQVFSSYEISSLTEAVCNRYHLLKCVSGYNRAANYCARCALQAVLKYYFDVYLADLVEHFGDGGEGD